MSEDSDDLDEQIKSRQHKRAKKDGGNRDQKFESGSEEEYVIGNTTAKQQ
jgi:hypothetical protein